ncbi:MAG TPA: FecR family protein [Candidatus Acidoferrum sp.]|nr:FecR family protein [Candidatus Acidoferrum sp.]
MKMRSWWVIGLAMALVVAIAFPPEVTSQALRSAGKISRMIPTVNLQRASKKMDAATQTPVQWGDTLLSQQGGRARIALEDGSILNLGSESSLTILSHDAATQKTQMQLAYGRVRSNVVRLARAGSSFEVRTPAAVAGVVGTDFYIAHENGVTTVIVFEGVVRVCALAGNCVDVHAGEMTTVREGQKPDSPRKASPADVMEAGHLTDVPGAEARLVEGGVHNRWVIFGLILSAVLPAVLIPTLTNRGGSSPSSTCTGPYCGI